MTSIRKHSAAVGGFFLLSHLTSIWALASYGPALHRARFLVDAEPATPVLLGSFLEVVLAIALIATAVGLYPIVRRAGEAAALGYVALRTLDAAVIMVGVVPMLTLVSLRNAGAARAAVGRALVSLHDATFLLGPGFVCAFDTAVLAALLLRSRQVPRFIPVPGLIGAPLLLLLSILQLFGVVAQYSSVTAVAALPVFA